MAKACESVVLAGKVKVPVPAKVTKFPGSPKLAAVALRVPPLIKTPPLKEFAPASVRVPAPVF